MGRRKALKDEGYEVNGYRYCSGEICGEDQRGPSRVGERSENSRYPMLECFLDSRVRRSQGPRNHEHGQRHHLQAYVKDGGRRPTVL